MSKSTPISTLRSSQPANEEKQEDTLVKEILDEIEQNGNAQNNPQPSQNEQQMMDQQIAEQQMMEQQMMEQQMMEQQMREQQMAEHQGIELEQNQYQPTLVKPNIQDNIIDLVKMPAIVGLLVIFLSLPQISRAISNLLPKKEMITKYIDYIVPIIKGLVGGGVYFGISKSL